MLYNVKTALQQATLTFFQNTASILNPKTQAQIINGITPETHTPYAQVKPQNGDLRSWSAEDISLKDLELDKSDILKRVTTA